MKHGLLSRRAWLSGTTASWAASACGGSAKTQPGAPAPSAPVPQPKREPGAPFGVWREVREALRTSPDHLPARAAALVGKKDPLALFAFVRDEVATHPATHRGVTGWHHNQRWGARGALRAGAGTPRDKADLLAQLLRQAGFADAQVVQVERELTAEQEKTLLTKQPERRFAPEMTVAEGQRWLRRLGIASAPETGDDPDPRGEQARDLAASVLKTGVDGSKAPVYRFGARGRVPAVRATVNGKTQLFELFAPEPKVHESTEGGKVEARKAAPVRVGLQVRVAKDGVASPPIELVSGDWNVADLVGRRLRVQMLPTLRTEHVLTAKLSDLTSFIPALSLEGPDVDQSLAQQHSVTGDAVTLSGQRIAVKGDTLELDGEALASDPGAIARVESLEVSADASRFPALRLNVRALDAEKKPVDGLGADAFSILDDGHGHVALLTRNRYRPKLALLVDQSLSMPKRYRGEDMKELVERLKQRVKEELPAAHIDYVKTGSTLWRSSVEAASGDADAVVYISDGDSADKPLPGMIEALKQGPPLMFAAVDERSRARLKHIADPTGARLVAVEQTEKALDETIALLKQAAEKVASYRLEYLARSEGAEKRPVRVTLTGGKKLVASTDYVPPKEPAPPRVFCSLEVTVKHGRQNTLTRRIAGWDARRPEESLERAINETWGALVGAHFIQVEGPSPTASVVLEEMVTELIALEPIARALDEGDDAIKKLLTDGVPPRPPHELLLGGVELPWRAADGMLTYETAPRMALVSEYVPVGEPVRRTRIDLIPITNLLTAADDAERAFRRTLENSAAVAVAEAALGETSTFRAVGAGPLAAVDRDFFQRLAREHHHYWGNSRNWTAKMGFTIVAPKSPQRAEPYYGVSKYGQLVAFLPDGSGGAEQAARIKQQLKQIDEALKFAGAARGLLGLSPALGIVISYGRVLARLYGAVAIAITMMDASDIPQAVRQALASFACDVVKTTGLVGFGRLGPYPKQAVRMFAGLQYIIGAFASGVGSKSPFSCW